MTDVWDKAALEAYQAWLVATESSERTVHAAFEAALTHARARSATPHADRWRLAVTEEVQALRTIVLKLAPSLPDLLCECEKLEKAWHKVCVETDDYQKHRLAEREFRKAQAWYDAVHRALQVLEEAQRRDEKA